MDTYFLIDSGNLKKLEKFGSITLVRPSPLAIWAPEKKESVWETAEAMFNRENRWIKMRPLLSSWKVLHGGFQFKVALTEFGNVGLFPEHQQHWPWIETQIKKGFQKGKKQVFILNLFAYTGGATFAAAKAGACVCHLDASKTTIAWAKENAQLNLLSEAPIRWIADDVMDFVKRELRRGHRYDGIILDPPTFGRGPEGQFFKIEQHLPLLIELCEQLLTEEPLFLLLTCHTPGLNPLVLHHLLSQRFKQGTLETGEMQLESTHLALPSGSFGRWEYVS